MESYLGVFFVTKHGTVQYIMWGMRSCSWLRNCASRQKVAGLISGGVSEIFH